MKDKGKLALPKNLGVKNMKGRDFKDYGRGVKGGKKVSTPIGSKEAKSGGGPKIKK